MAEKKILAVASIGGHWIQLLRLTEALAGRYEIDFVSTHPKCATMVGGRKFDVVSDFSRWDAYKLFPAFFRALKLVKASKADVVISTGAAPGLVVILAAKLLGKRTIWVDSVANAAELSMCGRIASHIASRTYTQWPELADGKKIVFAGNVIG